MQEKFQEMGLKCTRIYCSHWTKSPERDTIPFTTSWTLPLTSFSCAIPNLSSCLQDGSHTSRHCDCFPERKERIGKRGNFVKFVCFFNQEKKLAFQEALSNRRPLLIDQNNVQWPFQPQGTLRNWDFLSWIHCCPKENWDSIHMEERGDRYTETSNICLTHLLNAHWSEVKVTQSCPTLWLHGLCSPPGSSVHGILQSRILEWVAFHCPRGSSQPRDWT